MIQIINEVNSRVFTAKREKVSADYQSCVTDLNRLCSELYDLGYLETPYMFDKDYILECLSDEYGSRFIEQFENSITGDCFVTSLRAELAYRRTGEEIYSLLRDALYLSERLDAYNSLFSSVRFTKASGGANIQARYTLERRISCSGKVNIMNEHLLKSFDRADGSRIEKLNYLEFYLRKLAVEEFGCSDKDFLDAGVSNKSLYLGKGFTYKDDIEFAELLLDGSIVGNGVYGKPLYDLITKYNEECASVRGVRIRSSLPTFFEKYFEKYSDYIQSKILDRLNKYGGKSACFGITSRDILYLITDNHHGHADTELYIGSFAVDYLTGEPLDVINRLRGISGAFIPSSEIYTKGYSFKGVPMSLVTDGDKEESFFPIYNVRKPNGSLAFPRPKFKTNFLKVSDVCKMLEVDSLEDVADAVASSMGNTAREHSAEYNLLVGRLVQALICIVCDYVPFDCKSSNLVKLDFDCSWLTDEWLELARYTARDIFLNLGFK